MIPDNHAQLLQAVESEVNAQLLAHGRIGWKAYWPTQLSMEDSLLVLFLEQTHRRVTLFLPVPAAYVWDFHGADSAREAIAALLRQRIEHTSSEPN